MLTAAAAQAESSQEDLLPSLMHAQLWQEFNLSCLEEAETTAHTIIRLGDERGHLVHRLGAWTMLSGIALTRGDTALARRHLEPVVADDLASRARDDIRVLGLRLLQAWILAAEGNLGESRDLLGPLIASAKDSHRYWPWWPTWPSLFVRVGMGVQDDTFTAQALELALLGAERNPGVPSFEGVALQAQGLVRHDTALLGSAVEALRLSPRPSLLAGALTTYGRALMEQGDRDRSLTILDEAWDLNRRHGAISGLNAVAGILRQAGIRPRSRVVPPTLRPSTGWPSLTKSEFKVAELVSRGHTNRSAAAALSVSVNTVGTHLRSVFGKLNVRSRVELSNAWHAWQTDPPTPV
jgi:DNA-binding CsgD family transcriptional regulator